MELQRNRWSIEHRALTSGVGFHTWHSEPWAVSPRQTARRLLQSRGHLHLQGSVFAPLTRFLLSWCGCFLNCISSGQKEISCSAWRWRFFGSVFLCLLASTANRELPSFRLKLHIFFSSFSFFTFKAGSLIRAAFRQAVPGMRGVVNGAFLVLLAPFLCAVSAPCIINHLVKLGLCQ